MTKRPPNEVEKTDVDERNIIILMGGLLCLLVVIGFVLLKFDKSEFKKQKINKEFSGEKRILNAGEMDDFESGNPRATLDAEQRKHISHLDEAIKSLSTKSIEEIDGLFVSKREVKR